MGKLSWDTASLQLSVYCLEPEINETVGRSVWTINTGLKPPRVVFSQVVAAFI